MRPQQNLTSTQRGKVAELFVATALMSQSGGRLSPFEPLSDDHGVDLVVLDKATARALPIQVKSWLLDPERQVRTVQFDVQKTTFSADSPGAVVCVVMDPDTLTMSVGWMIPVADIPSVSTERPNKYALAPNPCADSRDRYSGYRHLTIASLTEAVEALLARDQAAHS